LEGFYLLFIYSDNEALASIISLFSKARAKRNKELNCGIRVEEKRQVALLKRNVLIIRQTRETL
jgi:hypothetical protein